MSGFEPTTTTMLTGVKAPYTKITFLYSFKTMYFSDRHSEQALKGKHSSQRAISCYLRGTVFPPTASGCEWAASKMAFRGIVDILKLKDDF